MSRLGVFTAAPDGSDVIWLGQLGKVAGLRFSRCYPGGDRDATWQMNLGPRFEHRAVQQGRQVGLTNGWRGNLDNPVRGDVWQFTAIGAAALAKRYLAVAPTSGNALNLAEVLATANTHGLGWTVSGSLPTLAAGTVPSATIYLDDALDQVSAGQPVPPYWFLDRHFTFTMGPPPTEPGYILLATDTGGGRTMDAFATDVYVTYLQATNTLATVVRSNVAARTQFGRFEVPDDISGLGLLAASQANDKGDGFLAKNSARAKFLNSWPVTHGKLRTANGTPIDLAYAVPGVLTSVLVTDPDSAGDVGISGPTNVLGGQTDYDCDSDVLTFTPTESAQDSLQALLANAG